MEGDFDLDDFLSPGERQEDIDDGTDEIGFEDAVEDETSFSDPPNVPFEEPGRTRDAAGHISDFRGDILRDNLVFDFYTEIERAYGLRPTSIDYDRFKVNKNGRTLYLKVQNKLVRITTTKGTLKFLNSDTIARNIGRGAHKPFQNFSTYQITALNLNRLPRSNCSKG